MSVSLWLQEKLAVPGPKALGMSDSDALGSEWLTPFQEGPTWQDWDKRVKKEYPVRYFISETIGGWVDRRVWFVERRWEWLVCHTTKRYHIVDLSNVDPLRHYRWGYLTPSTLMELAAWQALRLYIERCKPEDPATNEHYRGHEHEPWYDVQKKTYDEAQALYRYWMVERKEYEERDSALYQEVQDAGKVRDKERYEEVSEKWRISYTEREQRERDMFQRLAKLQPNLVV